MSEIKEEVKMVLVVVKMVLVEVRTLVLWPQAN